MPDYYQAKALDRQFIGMATKKDEEIVDKMYAPVQWLRTAAQVNPQIPMGFRTDLLPQWIPSRMPKFQQCFQILRAEWYSRQSSQNSLIDEVYQTFESIAYVFDFMVENPGYQPDWSPGLVYVNLRRRRL
eukprot:15339514-Ditylum_brightwellii.AAC.1